MSIIDTIAVDVDWFLKGKGLISLEEKKPETAQSPKWLTDWWQHADDEHWLKIQLNQILPVTKNTK